MANMDVTRLERAIAKQEQFMRAYIDPSLPPRNTKIGDDDDDDADYNAFS
jgi:hypothetical protein